MLASLILGRRPLKDKAAQFIFHLNRNVETYITICKIDSQREFAVWLRKLKQGLCINLERWDGEGDGMEVQKGADICIPMADSCCGLTENHKIL